MDRLAGPFPVEFELAVASETLEFRVRLRAEDAETVVELGQTELDRTELDRTELDRTELEQTELEQTELDRTELEQTELDRGEIERVELDLLDLRLLEVTLLVEQDSSVLVGLATEQPVDLQPDSGSDSDRLIRLCKRQIDVGPL